MVDDVDLRILHLLQTNARISNADIARKLNLAPSGTLERIRKLEDRGVIEGFHTRINPSEIGFGLLAYIHIKTNEKREKWDVAEIVSKIPGVLEVHDVAGDDCYMVKLRTKDTESLYELLRDEFGTIPSITSTRTTIVLRTVKDSTELPLGEGKEE